MVIIGSKGHATEVLSIILDKQEKREIVFFDDHDPDAPALMYEKYKVIKSNDQLKEYFSIDPDFVLGVGNPELRKRLANDIQNLGGKLVSAISSTAVFGHHNLSLGVGLNVMHNAFISDNTAVGEGTLINAASHVHHDCQIGQYCEIGPGAKILGSSEVGDMCQIGCNAVILPEIKVGNNVKVGAGGRSY